MRREGGDTETGAVVFVSVVGAVDVAVTPTGGGEAGRLLGAEHRLHVVEAGTAMRLILASVQGETPFEDKKEEYVQNGEALTVRSLCIRRRGTPWECTCRVVGRKKGRLGGGRRRRKRDSGYEGEGRPNLAVRARDSGLARIRRRPTRCCRRTAPPTRPNRPHIGARHRTSESSPSRRRPFCRRPLRIGTKEDNCGTSRLGRQCLGLSRQANVSSLSHSSQ